jgi:hypothetical protein
MPVSLIFFRFNHYGQKPPAFLHLVKLVGEIKYAVSCLDKIGIVALHTTEVVRKLRGYPAVDLPM